MKFFIWLNGEPESEIQRAIKVLNKQKVCNTFTVTDDVNKCNHFLIGNIKKYWFAKRGRFDHYDVKFSKTGDEAMISKKGSVEFFFASAEETKALKEAIVSRFT